MSALAIAVGLVLIVIPEPATTMAGVFIVLAGFGLEDEAPEAPG